MVDSTVHLRTWARARLLAGAGAALASTLLCPGDTGAQQGGAPAWPIHPASYPRPSHPATRATGPIVIDGSPDEAAWEAAPPITRFIQARPNLGFPATERTEVRILFDARALYVSCLCYDSEPDNLTVTSLERDFGPLDSDVFSFVLNPDPARQNAFLFYVNPSGALGDAQTFDDNRVQNYAWDGVVEVETRLTDFGWTVEMAIPWTTLRFDGA
ncbi:MAG TPA: carbohydrate binding family 9 domain-containing protein, partial [Longimicrobiales bacterium]|nr:carbohydrate binding family 9 domain-containing protein [Longimicrobiales bacterium]